MSPPAALIRATDRASAARPARAFVRAPGVALAGGVALGARAGLDGLGTPRVGLMLPHGPLLGRRLDEAQASPTRRAQAHPIFEFAGHRLRQERADCGRMAELFARPVVDAMAIEAVRVGLEQRPDAGARRATQALLDVGMVLGANQGRAIASRPARGARPFGGLRPPQAASAAF